MSSNADTSIRSSDDQRALTGAQSAQRTVDLLLLIAKSEEGMAPGELAQALGVERQVVYHLLQTLKPMGWVLLDSNGRWRIGPACAVIEQGLRIQSAAATSSAPSGELPAPSGAWLMIANENRMALLSSVRGRAALAALEELDSYGDF